MSTEQALSGDVSQADEAQHGQGEPGGGRTWTIFSSHGHVLFYLAANPDATLRAAADALGLTERRVASIVRDLVEAGMVRGERQGRRNHYTVDPDARLRHPTLAHVTLGRIIAAVAAPAIPDHECT